jgi:two-component system LytT family response regulator
MKLLIIDDEPYARKKIRNFLKEESGIEIIGECENGVDAVRAIQAGKPDAIFLDVQMPDLSGFEVLQALDNDDLPLVVFVTAFDQFALQAFEVHALDYLLKPFNHQRFQQGPATFEIPL